MITFNRTSRSDKLKINIVTGFGIKGLSMLLSLIFVPLVLNYLTAFEYGIWLTLNSVIAWFNMLDIGFCGGMRIRLQESITKGKDEDSKIFISTTYISLFIIAFIATLVTLLILHFLDLNYSSFFKVEQSYQSELSIIIVFTIISFFIRFFLQPISFILQADQMNFVASLILFTENLINCIGIFIISLFTQNSLLIACLIFCISPIINYVIYSLIFFNGKYRNIRPSVKYFRKEHLKSLLSMSLDLFIISISIILLAQVNNIMIVKLFSPNEVTEYNLVYKIFSSISMLFVLVMTPLWSAFGNAYNQNDFNWIERMFNKIKYFYLIILLVYIVLIISGRYIIKIWAGLDIDNSLLYMFTALYFIIQNYMMIYAYLFNGCGEFKIQRNMAIYGALVNIPIILFLVNIMKLGLPSVLIANTIAIIPSVIIYPLRKKQILNASKRKNN